MSAYATACEFARQGHPVFPVQGKVPLVGEGGFHKASTDPDTLRAWHNRFPTAGWAVVCGHGFSVADVDVKHGADVQEVLGLMAGPMVETGRANGSGRGLHVYAAGDVATGATAVKGVEIRGVGAYVVIPGSPHPSGETYEWVGDLRPWHEGALAPLPPELAPRRPEYVVVDEGGRIPRGARDDTLTSLAGTMRGRGMTAEAIYVALVVVNREQCDPPLPERQIAKIARSASTWEPGQLPEVSSATGERRPTDLIGLLKQPRKPVPWRVEELAADGKLTCLTGRGDAGKSWLAIACGLQMHAGGQVAGMRCAKGRALYIDAEMGEDEFVDRLRLFEASGEELDHIDGSGWDLSRKPDLDEIEALIGAGGYQFVVLDSLRALAPSMKENESDSVGPIITAVRNIARRTGAAIVLVHHRGDGEKAYRGSSAIRDQSDAMLIMHDDDGRGLRLQCKPGGRMRFTRAPEIRWLSLDLLGARPEGVKAAGEPEPPPPSAHEILKDQIVRHLPSETKAAVAEAVGTTRDASAFTRAWKALQNEQKIDQINGIWTVVVAGESLGSPPPPQHPQTTFGGDR